MPESLKNFDTYAAYRAALASVLSEAQHRLWFCERNLEESDLGSLAMHDLLWQLLVKTPAGKVRVLVQDPDYLINHCPRIMQLHERFSHNMEIRAITDLPVTWQQGFVLADEDGYLKRHHFDWPRGESGVSGRESAALETLFNQLWEHANPPIGMHSLSL